MLRQIHYKHVGGEACNTQVCKMFYWPNMQGEIKDYVQHCSMCNVKKTMMSHLLPTRPWLLVSRDLFNHAGQDFLLVVDHYLDFWEIDLLPDLSVQTMVQRCKAQFTCYGIPDQVISNCGCQFKCGTFCRFAGE